MEKTVKTPNYTAEQTAEMTAAYVANPTKATVEALALKMGKSLRSITAKLARERVYVAKTYVSKNGEKPVAKDAVADAIGKVLNLTESETSSLTAANKTALNKIFAALANSTPV